jgi:hypothetical protein
VAEDAASAIGPASNSSAFRTGVISHIRSAFCQHVLAVVHRGFCEAAAIAAVHFRTTEQTMREIT